MSETCTKCGTNKAQRTRLDSDINLAAIRLEDAQLKSPALVDRYAAEIRQLKDDRAEHIARTREHIAFQHGSDVDQFRRSPAHRLTDDDRHEIRQLLRDGVPGGEIAEAFGVSPSTVSDLAVRAGLGRDDKPKAPAPELPSFNYDLPEWMSRGLCAQIDPESFFPEKGGSTREAKRVCAVCTVSAECLDYALSHEERFGIWGGLSERDRRQLARAIKTPTTPTKEPDQRNSA